MMVTCKLKPESPLSQRSIMYAAEGCYKDLTVPQLAQEVLRLRKIVSERDLQLRKMKEKMDNMAKDICIQKKEIEDLTKQNDRHLEIIENQKRTIGKQILELERLQSTRMHGGWVPECGEFIAVSNDETEWFIDKFEAFSKKARQRPWKGTAGNWKYCEPVRKRFPNFVVID